MTVRNIIPLSHLRESLVYDPETGAFTWLRRPREHFGSQRACSIWNARYAGKRAGWIGNDGYLYISLHNSLTLDGRLRHVVAQRIAWALMTGTWPEHEVAHHDGDRLNYRWSNLREASLDAKVPSSLRGAA